MAQASATVTNWWSTGRSDLRPAGTQLQLPTFATAHEDKHIGRLLGEVMDEYGTHAIGLGRAGKTQAPHWGMKRAHLSPRYTTKWDEVPIVRAA